MRCSMYLYCEPQDIEDDFGPNSYNNSKLLSTCAFSDNLSTRLRLSFPNVQKNFYNLTT